MRIRVVGDSDQVSDKVRQALNDAERAAQENDTLVLTVAFNYGGRWDIVQACRRAMEAGVTSRLISVKQPCPDSWPWPACARIPICSFARGRGTFV